MSINSVLAFYFLSYLLFVLLFPGILSLELESDALWWEHENSEWKNCLQCSSCFLPISIVKFSFLTKRSSWFYHWICGTIHLLIAPLTCNTKYSNLCGRQSLVEVFAICELPLCDKLAFWIFMELSIFCNLWWSDFTLDVFEGSEVVLCKIFPPTA